MDINLFYTEAGQGEPLILLHGNGEDSSYFVHQIAYFQRKYHVIAVDTRGHGNSPRGAAPFTIRQFADDLCCFMNQHNIENAHILGFSDGGNIALCFALKYSERVKSLILNGANLFPRGVKFSVQFPVEIGYRVAKVFHKKEKYEMLGLMINDPDLTFDEIRNIKSPALVIAGDKDMIKDRHTQLIAENLPLGKLEIIKGSHFCAAENPSEFNEKVSSFLNTV